MIDLAIIGAGPAGYIAAIRARQLGLSVVLIEREALGGVCLNWGCIPSKHLIHRASQFNALNTMEAMGVGVDRSSLEYAKVNESSRAVVSQLGQGILGLMKRHGVEVRNGSASFSSKGTLSVSGKEFEARHILIATGARPTEIAGFEFDHERVLSSTDVLRLKTLPQSIVILGGGAIGCEMAYIFASFGVAITLVEAEPHLLPTEDVSIGVSIKRSLQKLDVAVKTNTRALRPVRGDNNVSIELLREDESESIDVESALVAFGRTPNTDNLDLCHAGVELDARGFIITNASGQTANPNIFAAGDVVNTPMLAHAASAEAERAVEVIAGVLAPEGLDDAMMIPSAIYTEPQAAGFGVRETGNQALPEGLDSVQIPLSSIGKSVAIGSTEGFVKVIFDETTKEIVGGHIVGQNATELIHELLLMKSAELLPDDIVRTMHAHPTLSEANQEAMRAVLGGAYHA